jgi:NRPS condensation-like uncharacterized protein
MPNVDSQQSIATKKSRPVSASEKVYIALDRLFPPFVNQFVLEGVGSIDYKQLLNAVEISSQANPGSRLVLRGRLGWSRWVDSGITPPVQLLNGASWSGKNPEGAGFLSEPLPVRAGPTCDVTLLPGDPMRIVFRTHHAVMDARGTLLWVEDIFRVLNGEAPIGSTLGLTDTQLAKSLKAGTAKNVERIYPAPTGVSEGNDNGMTWRRIQINGRHSMLLPKVAIFIAQQPRKSHGDDILISIPVDMRQHAAVKEENTGNLTGFIKVIISAHSTPAEITQQIQTKLEQREYAALNQGISIAPHLPIRLLVAGVQQSALKMRQDSLFYDSAILSNLGRLNLPAYTTKDFKPSSGFFIPPGTGASPLFMSLAGNENGIDVIATVPKMFASNGRVDQFMSDLAKFLG